MVVGSKKVWEELGAKRTSEHRRPISRNARNVSKMSSVRALLRQSSIGSGTRFSDTAFVPFVVSLRT